MVLPLIPIAIGLTGTAAGAALNHWLTNTPDAWSDRNVFNARMRDMQLLATALNTGLTHCPEITSNDAQLSAWRAARDGFSRFYHDIGALNYLGPNDAEIEQAKSYASKFYFWTGEYNRLDCGSKIPTPIDPAKPPAPVGSNLTDWATIIKWSVIGIGGAFLIKTVSDLFKTYRP